MTLAEPSFFEHGRSCTLWLRPDSASDGELLVISISCPCCLTRVSSSGCAHSRMPHGQHSSAQMHEHTGSPCSHCSLLPAELLAVQAALERAFSQCSDLSSDAARGITAFTPHLSLGQWRSRADVQAAAAQLAAGWSPLSFEVAGVGLMSRQGFEDPFQLDWFVPLHGGEPVAVGAPYIATVGDSTGLPAAADAGNSSGSDHWSSFFGIGAAQQDGSVWQFAYGANMAPRKLNGARGLHPLESLPASLPGWRLAFTHRGGKLDQCMRANLAEMVAGRVTDFGTHAPVATHAMLARSPRVPTNLQPFHLLTGMGNLVPLAPGETGPAGLGAVHGVVHRLSAADYGRLCCMEHEYRCACAGCFSSSPASLVLGS